MSQSISLPDIRFSSQSTQFLLILFAAHPFVVANSFMPESTDAVSGTYNQIPFSVTALLYIALAFKIKFVSLKNNMLQIGDFFGKDYVDPKNVIEVRLLFYTIYLLRLKEESKYGTRIFFARSIRDTIFSILKFQTFENKNIRELREFATANQLEQSQLNAPNKPELAEVKFDVSLNPFFYRFVYVIAALTLPLRFINIVMIISTVGTTGAAQKLFSIETVPMYYLILFYPVLIFNMIVIGVLFVSSYIAFIAKNIHLTSKQLTLRSLGGSKLSVSIENLRDMQYIYDWIYMIKYVDPDSDKIKRAFFARSLKQSIYSLFTEGTIEHNSIREIRRCILEQRYQAGLTEGNPMMALLPNANNAAAPQIKA